MTSWNPNTFRRSDVAVLGRGDSVFGPLPRLCKECDSMQVAYQPYTHRVLCNTPGAVTHLTRLIHGLENGNGKTFCNRLFSFQPKVKGGMS